MRILLVEDDENKGQQLKQFFDDVFPGSALYLARSLQSAVKHIRLELPDLVILDMTLPNYDASPDEPGGGATHSFGGREFLRQMDRFDIDVPVIVVTQFETFGKAPHSMDLDELDGKLRAEHSPMYRGSVYYHASIRGWQDQLRRAIEAALGRSADA